ncbi:MAG: 4-hydroxy-3-methylbut-2-enyl diphosphate reductase [Acidimicrobiales bacterium]|jgi:4-hydroxy-3-methylbut-2-en-1-yl diphosphate reductase
MAAIVAGELGKAGLGVHVGPIVSLSPSLRSSERGVRVRAGAVVVDARSASLVHRLPRNPLAIVHAVSHATNDPAGGRSALASLRSVRSPLERWARACGSHEVVLASPRSFCAGVERAIEIVRRALERYGAPVYVRRQIVHNLHVVRDLESRGAIFVEELDEVPERATVVFAAHGVSPAVRAQADVRGDLKVIDATCPLVAKVHTEARRYAAQGHHLVLIGHADHEEIEGTLGEAPGRFHLVERSDDVQDLDLDPEQPVAYLTQTTLATDETAEIVAALRHRFPRIVAPPADDICYATQNRQDAVRSIAHRCDLMLVVGSANSSNTARLVEVARREGCRSELVEDASQLQLGWLDSVGTIGLTAGASAPEFLVHELLETLRLLGPLTLSEATTTEETVRFALPTQVR